MSRIEILPIEQLRALPECGRNDAGVYFLWRDDELLYIGRSKNIHNRLLRHPRGVIPFTRHTVLSIDYETLGWRIGLDEAAYIAHYSPPYNVMSTAAWNASRAWA
jgi:excinuclease UvrABC nuclease subunit